MSAPLSFIKNTLKKLYDCPPILWSMITLGAAYFMLERTGSDVAVRLKKGWLVLAIAAFFQAAFARAGLMFRLEAALVGLFLIQATGSIWVSWPKKWSRNERFASVICAILIALPFLARARYANVGTVKSIDDFRSMHFEAVEFFEQNPHPKSVAINDLGIFGYYSKQKWVDVVGLGTTEVLKNSAKADSTRFDQFLESKNVCFTMLFDQFFDDLKTENWQLVGKWIVVGAGPNISQDLFFFSRCPEETAWLRQRLIDFSAQKRRPFELWIKPI